MQWSVLKAAREWGIDRETLAKRLVAAGFKVDARSQFHTKQISDAIHGDLQAERIRLIRAQAELKEKEHQVRQGSLISEEKAREIMASRLGAIRAEIERIPLDAPRCNPAKPALARAVLEERRNKILEAGQV
jgi:phage terminase Nu1 subunit (DNA packaging protein)